MELSESRGRSPFRLSSSWRPLVLAAALSVGLVTPGLATDTVHDPIHTILNVLQQTIGQVKEASYHSADIAKYTEMISKQAQQIQQLTQIINQNVEALKRFGDPQYYTNMLGLDQLIDEINTSKSGIGQTIGEVSATANGFSALKNTAAGLYDDLSKLPDRFGNKVQMDLDGFKRFGLMQDLYHSYNTDLQSANSSINRLQQDKQTTLRQLNAAGSLVETEKWKGKLEAIQGSLDSWAARINAAGSKVLVQEAANRDDEARQAWAAKQAAAQSLATDTATLLVGGYQSLDAHPRSP
jgi:hypothetical protein